MSKKTVLFADSTCDLGEALCTRYNVRTVPYHITLDGKEYQDNVDIDADRLYAAWYDHKALPKTSAISVGEYLDCFTPWVEQGYEILHMNLGSALSASHANCKLAAAELPGVYPVDTHSLSTGTGLQVIRASEMLAAGASAAEIQAELSASTRKAHASFILDTLEFMHAGGRCSALAMLGANMLSLKPCIEVDNSTGGMGVGKKYRGKLAPVLVNYVRDKLAAYPDIVTDHIFITHSGIDDATIELVRKTILEYRQFDEIFVTRAACTISSHCGPRTLGVLFMTESEAK